MYDYSQGYHKILWFFILNGCRKTIKHQGFCWQSLGKAHSESGELLSFDSLRVHFVLPREQTDNSFSWTKKASLIPGPLQAHATTLVINKLKYFNKTRYSQLHKISLHWFKKPNKPLDCIWGACKLISVISQSQFFLNCLKKQNYLRQD